jgi:hypothetical protein
MRKTTLGIAGAITLMVAAPVLWLMARHRGVSEPRLIVASGQTTMDDVFVQANQPVAQGARLRTGLMSISCLGVHTTRVCLGANTSMRLVAIGASDTLDVAQGTVVVGTSGEPVLLTVPGGSLQVSQGIVEVEVSPREVLVRAYEGSIGMTAGSAAASTVTAPAVLNLEGKKRPPIPPLEAEERAMITLARAWQGGSSGTVQINGTHGHVVVDGLGLGRPPVSVLLNSGPHTILLREADQELMRKTVDVSSGQNVVVSE